MLKYILMILFMFMLVEVYKSMLMFLYNLMYLCSFMMIFMYMYKDTIWVNISVAGNMGVDYFSFWLIILSVWIISLMTMCLVGEENNLIKIMMFMLLLLVLMMMFMFLDLLYFYLMFEVSLIPTFFLIVYWGSNYERISASFYLMMYMLLISLPLLVYILYIYSCSLSSKFSILVIMMSMFMFSGWGYLIIYLAFFIKLPIYIFHLWLPKAHVEAPVYGSMILAGVLLKMGGYGLIRFLEVFIKSSVKFSYLTMAVGLVGALVMSMVCLIQIDMKSLVAYSSIVHMNFMLSGLMTMTKLGMISSYIMMISHGLCSSALFFMVNLYYMNSGSRLLLLNKGAMGYFSILALWWFILCIFNFSFPISLSFFSEILLLSVLINWEVGLMLILMLVCFFSSVYSLYLFAYIQHGSDVKLSCISSGGSVMEFMILIIHVSPLSLFLLNLLEYM